MQNTVFKHVQLPYQEVLTIH